MPKQDITSLFSSGNADQIMQMIASKLDQSDPSAASWQERSLFCLRAIAHALVWMRDNEGFDLNLETFCSHLTLEAMEGFYLRGYLAKESAQASAFFLPMRYLEDGLPGYELKRLLRKHGLSTDPGPTEQDLLAYEKFCFFGLSGGVAALDDLAKQLGHPALGSIAYKTAGSAASAT